MPSTGALVRLIVSNREMDPTSPPAGRALRDIAVDLIELTGLSQRDVATRAGVHRPNLTTWLSGKAQQLSEANQLAVLNALGWQYGRLAAERLHFWWVGHDFSAASRVLRAEAEAGAKIGIVRAEDWEDAQGAAAVLIADGRHVQRLVVICRPLAVQPPQPPEVNASALGVGITLRDRWAVDRARWIEIATDPIDWVFGTLPDSAFLELLGAPTLSQVSADDATQPVDWDLELKTMFANWTEEERADWIALLSALRYSGLSPSSIARKLGVAMRSARVPFWSAGWRAKPSEEGEA